MSRQHVLKQCFILLCFMTISQLWARSDRGAATVVMAPLKQQWRHAKTSKEKEEATKALDAFAVISKQARRADKHEARAERLAEQNKRLFAQHQDLARQVGQLKQRVSIDEEEHSGRTQKLATKLHEYEQENSALAQEVSRLRAENQQLREQLASVVKQ